ncbi:two-component system phosphate regulon sensor histidine kinase PhoR [Metabacillus crassostreae]|uniref:two-component system histidine kinase PnpS n=1 Tax=Metabacillus crassostreae TaxID=929098 RepID=UPI00195979E4|nr:HAMP domain-containing sensor histidine kinase [Metabacillus crassostreae]MBM7605661.1 two-component system phosphate regulon sensor histidine kinase PhoR [Metabacillus crassostreae]
MSRFRSRFLFALTTLIIAVLVGLGLLLGQIFDSYYMNSFKDELRKEALLAKSIYLDDQLSGESISNLVAELSENFNSHITIIDQNDKLILDEGENTNHDHQFLLEEILPLIKDEGKAFYYTDKNNNIAYYSIPLDEQSIDKGVLIINSSIDSLIRVNQQMWGILGASLGLAFIIILLLGIRITAQFTRPIESATQVAMELAKGNYKARTYEDHLDETGMLSQSINILARNLQDMTRAQEMQQDRLQTLIENMGSGLILIDGRGYINLVNLAYKELFNVDSAKFLYQLYHDAFTHHEIIEIVEEIFMTEVKVRKQLHLPLAIERRHFEVYGAPIIGTNDEWKGIVLVFHDISELKKLEQMRKDFVANVSHELKTPITSIKGFSETLLDGALSDKQTAEYFLSIILKESDRLQSLIQDLLDLSKIEQQGFQLSVQNCDLKEIIEDIRIMLEGKAKEKEVNLTIHYPEGLVFIEGDIYRLKQIFINLISNALTYTPKEGSVSVTLENFDEHTMITVSDTGIGISTEEIPRIFERFYRVDRARSRNSGGTGLGLAIVKHLVEAHKGQISVQSKIGEGTTFSVKLYKKWIDK